MEDFMKKVLVFLAILVVLALTGCTSTAPLDLTNNTVGSKVGESSGTVILGGIFTKDLVVDYSIQTAAKNAGITRVATVDTKVYKVFNFVTTYTTIVTGE
jgi:outer membrane lipoprotein SlyB